MRVHVAEGLEAARGEARGHGGGNLIVERDLVAARVHPPSTRSGRLVLRMRELGAPAAAGSYVRRSRRMRESTVARALSTTTSQTRPSPSAPERRSASVRYSALAALGRDSVVMADLQVNLHEQSPEAVASGLTKLLTSRHCRHVGSLARRLTERVAPGEGGAGHQLQLVKDHQRQNHKPE